MAETNGFVLNGETYFIGSANSATYDSNGDKIQKYIAGDGIDIADHSISIKKDLSKYGVTAANAQYASTATNALNIGGVPAGNVQSMYTNFTANSGTWGTVTGKADKTGLDDEIDARETADIELQNQINALEVQSDVVDVVGTKAELEAYDTSTLYMNDIVKVLADESQGNAIAYWRWTGNIWMDVGTIGPYYTQSKSDERYLSNTDAKIDIWNATTTTVNSKYTGWDNTTSVVDSKSVSWDAAVSTLDDNADTWISTTTKVNASADKWNSTYETVSTCSGSWAGGGMSMVEHDTTLTGSGTKTSKLGVDSSLFASKSEFVETTASFVEQVNRLDDRVDSVHEALSNEVTAREASETALGTRILNAETLVNNETAARAAADNTLQQAIDNINVSADDPFVAVSASNKQFTIGSKFRSVSSMPPNPEAGCWYFIVE